MSKVSLLVGGLLLFSLVFLYAQKSSGHKLWTIYSYNQVLINQKRVSKNYHTELSGKLSISTGPFSSYECQIDENIAIIVKSNTTLNIIPSESGIVVLLKEGEVLFKLSKLKHLLEVKKATLSIRASDGEFRVIHRGKKSVIQVRKGNISLILPDKKEIEVTESRKADIINGKLEGVSKITDSERNCLNDLRDVIFYKESELLKQDTKED
jgi:hypothetical protein